MLPLPADHELVIASSGIVAEKIGAARDRYNDLSQSARRIAARWREMASREQATLGDACAALSSEDMEVLIRAGAADTDRLAQFVLESTELIPQAGDALGAGDLKQLGALVDRSQDAAERCLRNQIPETIWLQRDARLRGAAAASAFGAGFGGSVWALVRADHAREFCDAWSRRYAEHFPSAATNAKFFRTRAGPPAAQL
jgi:galactokinase